MQLIAIKLDYPIQSNDYVGVGVPSEDDLLLPVRQGAVAEPNDGAGGEIFFAQALRLEWLDQSESYFGDANSKLSIFDHTVSLQQVAQ